MFCRVRTLEPLVIPAVRTRDDGGGIKTQHERTKLDMACQDEDQTPEAPKAEVYEAPKVLRVSLRPAEAVLGHCKVTGSGGPVSGSCRNALGACRTPGS